MFFSSLSSMTRFRYWFKHGIDATLSSIRVANCVIRCFDHISSDTRWNWNMVKQLRWYRVLWFRLVRLIHLFLEFYCLQLVVDSFVCVNMANKRYTYTRLKRYPYKNSITLFDNERISQRSIVNRRLRCPTKNGLISLVVRSEAIVVRPINVSSDAGASRSRSHRWISLATIKHSIKHLVAVSFSDSSTVFFWRDPLCRFLVFSRN